MSAPVFFLPENSLKGAVRGSELTLAGSEGRHATKAMRVEVGESIDLADGSGVRARSEVLAVDSGAAELTARILALTSEPQPRPRMILIQALAKDGRDEQAIESATELGIDAIIPWQADRSIVRWRAERASKAHAKWRNVVFAAAKQSRRVRVPHIEDLATTAQLIQRLSGAGTAVAVLHEAAEVSLYDDLAQFSSGSDEIALVVGPEGGISERELSELTRSGAKIYRLGPEVLRASTAGPVALTVANVVLGRWS